MKIVINRCYGGFSVSKKAIEYMANLGSDQAKAELLESMEDNSYNSYYGCSQKYNFEYDRTDPYLIEAVETLGREANGCFSKLKVVEIPDIEWEIINHEGIEVVIEKHRIWS